MPYTIRISDKNFITELKWDIFKVAKFVKLLEKILLQYLILMSTYCSSI